MTSTRRIVGIWRMYEEKESAVGSYCHQLSRRTLTTSPQSAMIRHDAMHGYDATYSKVIFINSTVLEESESRTKYVRHLWRWIETSGSESGGNGFSILTAQPAEDFNPGVAHKAVNIERSCADGYSGSYSAIFQRV
jgi:hypothetical protein